MPTKSQAEMEAPAKQYQILAISEQIRELTKLVKSNAENYVTAPALELALERRDNRIKQLEDKNKTVTKVFWIVLTPVMTYLVTNSVIQFLTNQGRVGQ